MDSATPRASLDKALGDLQASKDRWATMPIAEQAELLTRARHNLRQVADRWVDLSIKAKQIDPDSPWVGEEWVSGPWALAAGLNGYAQTLHAVAHDHPIRFNRVTTRTNGQVVVTVFPADWSGWLLLNGLSAEVWMQPGVTTTSLQEHVARRYRQRQSKGRVAVVLGAGNINAIAPLDALYKLYAEGEVVILKMNPVNEYVGPLLEAVFEPLITAGYLRVVYGGAEVGAYLTAHDLADTIHVTGSQRTYDAIVFGTGPAGDERKRQRQPLLDKTISAELGGVGPCIVVPGPWSEADIRFQAEHIATMKLHNSGCNCIAAQVLVLPREWEHSGALLDAVRAVMRRLPPRAAYYPGCATRQRAAVAAYPEAELIGQGETPRTIIPRVDAERAGQSCFTDEFFGPVLAVTSLAGSTPAQFLGNAVRFANERLQGTLGASIVVHPKTMRELGPRLDEAVGDLEYGTIGVNAWSGCAFLLAQAPWGPYPGHTPDDIQSGIGVVHNTFLLEKTEKTVVRGSFYPFPRTWLHGDPAFLPRPPWFVTNKTAQATARRVAYFALDPRLWRLPGIFASALRG